MRLYGLKPEDVEAARARPDLVGRDSRGNSRVIGKSLDGRRIVLVIALDDPEFVITVFESR